MGKPELFSNVTVGYSVGIFCYLLIVLLAIWFGQIFYRLFYGK